MAVNGFSQLEALKRQVNGSIDGIQKAIELLPFWDDLNGSWTFELVTPIGYLLQLANALDIMDCVKDFLAKTITWSLPAIEVGVKGIILSNLTQCLSCSTHPFIPDYMRTMYYKRTFNIGAPTLETKVVDVTKEKKDGTTSTKKKTKFVLNKGEFSFEQTPVLGPGINIPLSSIDYDDMLSHSPFAKWDKSHDFVDPSEMYFGTTDANGDKLSPFMMARAEDCNAYLWFVKNRGYFKDAINITTTSDATTQAGAHLLGFISIPDGCVGGSLKNATNGTGVRYADSMSLSLVADVQFDNSGNATSMKLLPVSSNSTNTNKPSINWYYNPKLAWTSNLTEYAKKPRDYTKDRPIYSLTYSGGVFNFTILPKPLIHYPVMITRGQTEKFLDGTTEVCENGWYEKLTHERKILFDSEGQPQKTSMNGGRFTVSPVIIGKKIERLRVSHDNHDYVYRLYKAKDVFSGKPMEPTPDEPELVLYYTPDNGEYYLRKYIPATGGGTPTFDDNVSDELLAKYLYECYPGLTIYQFNYDYIMGMRLFDSKVIMTRLMNQLFNLNPDLKITADQTAAREEIREMVRRVINSSEQTDNCFFSFTNDEINRLTQDAINKHKDPHTHIGNTPLDDESIELLQAAMQGVFNSTNKGAQKDAVSSAIDAGIATATKFVPSETKYGASVNFLEDMCVELILQIVLNSLMTPKVAMLLQVNKEFIGQPASLDINFQTLLKSMINLIYSIVKEIVTMLLQELFELILAKLGGILSMFGAAILAEYLDYYTELIKEIITQCGFRIGMGPNNSGIDNVNYADIDEVTSTPSPDNC